MKWVIERGENGNRVSTVCERSGKFRGGETFGGGVVKMERENTNSQ
jgi:hypothetical protein